MIECPTCKVSFSPRHRLCPRCKAFEARLEDRVGYLTNTAETALDQGVSPVEVELKLGGSVLEESTNIGSRAQRGQLLVAALVPDLDHLCQHFHAIQAPTADPHIKAALVEKSEKIVAERLGIKKT